jgi:two-component system, cell cycle sensor histidine kinase and response regulator CckA
MRRFGMIRPETYSDEMFCRIVEYTQELLYRTDISGRLLFLNPSAAAFLAVPDNEWHGKLLSDFVHEDDRSRLEDTVSSVHATGEPSRNVELRMLDMRGVVHLTRHSFFSMDRTRPDLGILGCAVDRDELKRLEDQLQQSQKLETIGLLAGGIAHDFNNMLAAILGFTELMIEEREVGDPDLRTLNYIQKGTERAAALVKQLLAYSRKTTAELKPIRLCEVVKETLGIVERTLPKNIRIVAYTAETEDAIHGDAGRIEQALLNLCLNARDAMPRGGELRITVENIGLLPEGEQQGATDGSYVLLKVQDTGTGMSPDVLEKIWEPFFTTKEVGKGTGLGLALVQSILHAHGGFVQVESHAGGGTAFYLYLPTAPSHHEAKKPGLVEPMGGNETVLVVDDEQILLDLLVDILGRKGYRVITAGSGRDALERLAAGAGLIDLVISDNMMPGMMGRDLAREIRRVAPGTRVVLCSGYNAGTEPEPGELDNVSAYVQKPYQRRELLTRVREVLDARQKV